MFRMYVIDTTHGNTVEKEWVNTNIQRLTILN